MELTDEDQALLIGEAERARSDINAFAEFCFDDDETGEPLEQAWIHRRIQEAIPPAGVAKNVVILCFRSAGKSVQTGIIRVLWELGHNPNLRVKIVTANDDLATKTITALKQHIESNWRLQLVFPNLKPGTPWQTQKFNIERSIIVRDCSVEAYGVLSGATGGRADLIVMDDIVDRKNAVSQPKMREEVKATYGEVWANILSPRGREIFCGTIYHSDDLCAHLRRTKDPKYEKVVIPAIWDEESVREHKVDKSLIGKPVWPDKFGMEELQARKIKIGPKAFARQFELKVQSEEDKIFPDHAIEAAKTESYDFTSWDTEGSPISPDWPRYIGVDLASSMKKRGAYTVIFTIAVSPNGIRYPLNIIRAKMQFPEVIRALKAENRRFNPQKIIVENNAFQEAVITQMGEDDKSIPIKGQFTGVQKWDEDTGLPGLAVRLENGAWKIPYKGGDKLHGELGHTCNICSWITELREAPLGETSDILMAMWLADCAASTGRILKVPETRVYTLSQIGGK